MSLVKSRVARLDSISKNIWMCLKADIRQEEETIELMKESLAALQTTISFIRKERVRSNSKQSRNSNLAIAVKQPTSYFSQASFKPPKNPHLSGMHETEQNRKLEISLNISHKKLNPQTNRAQVKSSQPTAHDSSGKEPMEPGTQETAEAEHKERTCDFAYDSMEPHVEVTPHGHTKINIFAETRESLNDSRHINHPRDHLKLFKSRTPVTNKRRSISKKRMQLTGKAISRTNSGSASKPSSRRKYKSLACLLPIRSAHNSNHKTDQRITTTEQPKDSPTANRGLLKNRTAALSFHHDVTVRSKLERPRGSTHQDRYSELIIPNQTARTGLSTKPKLQQLQHLSEQTAKANNMFLKQSEGFIKEPNHELSCSGKTPPSTVASEGIAKTSTIIRELPKTQPSDFSENHPSSHRGRQSAKQEVLQIELLPESQVLIRQRTGLDRGGDFIGSRFAKKKSTNN